jgi:choline dehydrogenase-like flavoprotein
VTGVQTCALPIFERGAHNSPVQDFSDDELRMIRTLYAEGGLQLSRTFDFTVLQGETVGGSTVINNAICIEMPEVTKREWAGHGIDLDSINLHYANVKGEINIAELDANAVNQNVEALFRRGVSGYNAAAGAGSALEGARVLTGNFLNCVGCGLCNIGCRRLRKLSALETYLPWAESRGVVIHSNVDAVKCETQPVREGGKKVTSVLVRRQGGEFKRVRVRKAAILAGGAIASSRFLMRSELGGERVGKRLSCNYALPTLVEFDETVDAFDGLQITMFAAPESYNAIFETTYNAPGAYSISLPLHFGEHFKMMSAYRNGVNFGALVGSDPCGEVRRSRDIMFGRAIEWEPTEGDIKKVKDALKTLVGVGRAAGGNRIILPTRPALVIPLRNGVDVDEALDGFGELLKDRKDFNFVTAHPQGGNMMAGPESPNYKERVVEVDFRVRGTDNLFVCDASIFPTGARVNPQWTIMALASIASESVVKRFG